MLRTSRFEVTIDRRDGMLPDGDNAFLVAFANDSQETGVEMEVLNAEAAEFGQSEAARVGDFENRLVTECVGSFRS